LNPQQHRIISIISNQQHSSSSISILSAAASYLQQHRIHISTSASASNIQQHRISSIASAASNIISSIEYHQQQHRISSASA
jgi:hypothetical protein